ncbi:MAG TPA: ATP-binding protein [Bryobacteraceae bacterium]|nr:ATP-binding protein [Bryobacteraceae bacterium]
MIHSFRFRITAWYVAFFSLLFVLFGVFLYGVLAGALEARLDERLSEEASTAANLFLDEIDELKGDIPKAAAEAVSEMRLRGSTVAVFAGSRMLAASSPGAQSELESVAAGSWRETDAVVPMPHFGKSGGRAAAHRLTAGGVSYLVLAAEPLDSIQASLQVVRRVLFFGLPFLLGIAGVGGYLLTTRSLAPLGWMAEQSRRITGSNLETRLDIGNAAEELKVLTASFNELLARLDQSFEGMRRFVADASHELRTPVSVIRGEAEVALFRDRGPAEYRESLAIILDESRRLSRLVDDLLNLARADAGHFRLQVAEFYFNDLMADCCRSVQTLAASRNIQVECRGGGDVPFRGDEELLRRLVMNLLDNAIRYTPSGGRVTASLEAEGPDVRIRVSDTGPGIAPEAAAHVFERFYRADKARSREEGGFGLGLSIVKWIAESHNGAVELASRPDEGSVFTVTLPR